MDNQFPTLACVRLVQGTLGAALVAALALPASADAAKPNLVLEVSTVSESVTLDLRANRRPTLLRVEVNGRRMEQIDAGAISLRPIALSPSDGLEFGENRVTAVALLPSGRRLRAIERFTLERDEPLASAGPDLTDGAVGDQIPLDGTGSEPAPQARGVLENEWKLLVAPPEGSARIIDPSSRKAGLEASAPGTYIVRNTVTQSNGEQASDTTCVQVPATSPAGGFLRVRPDLANPAGASVELVTDAGVKPLLPGTREGSVRTVLLDRSTLAPLNGTSSNAASATTADAIKSGIANAKQSTCEGESPLVIVTGSGNYGPMDLEFERTLLRDELGAAIARDPFLRGFRGSLEENERRPFAVVGVPGAPRGTALSKVADETPFTLAGQLLPDSAGNYAFAPLAIDPRAPSSRLISAGLDFSISAALGGGIRVSGRFTPFPAPVNDAPDNICERAGGFAAQAFDATTLTPVDGITVYTGCKRRGRDEEIGIGGGFGRLTAYLKGLEQPKRRPLVMVLRAFGPAVPAAAGIDNQLRRGEGFGKDVTVAADLIRKFGGSAEAFASKRSGYAIVGRNFPSLPSSADNDRPVADIEISPTQPAPVPAEITGTLTPDEAFRFVAGRVETAAAGLEAARTVDPTRFASSARAPSVRTPFPGEGEPRYEAVLRSIARQLGLSGTRDDLCSRPPWNASNVRSNYCSGQDLSLLDLRTRVSFDSADASARDYDRTLFDEVVKQLDGEFQMVANVRAKARRGREYYEALRNRLGDVEAIIEQVDRALQREKERAQRAIAQRAAAEDLLRDGVLLALDFGAKIKPDIERTSGIVMLANSILGYAESVAKTIDGSDSLATSASIENGPALRQTLERSYSDARDSVLGARNAIVSDFARLTRESAASEPPGDAELDLAVRTGRLGAGRTTWTRVFESLTRAENLTPNSSGFNTLPAFGGPSAQDYQCEVKGGVFSLFDFDEKLWKDVDSSYNYDRYPSGGSTGGPQDRWILARGPRGVASSDDARVQFSREFFAQMFRAPGRGLRDERPIERAGTSEVQPPPLGLDPLVYKSRLFVQSQDAGKLRVARCFADEQGTITDTSVG